MIMRTMLRIIFAAGAWLAELPVCVPIFHEIVCVALAEYARNGNLWMCYARARALGFAHCIATSWRGWDWSPCVVISRGWLSQFQYI